MKEGKSKGWREGRGGGQIDSLRLSFSSGKTTLKKPSLIRVKSVLKKKIEKVIGNQIIYSNPFYNHKLDNIFLRCGFCYYHAVRIDIKNRGDNDVNDFVSID